MYSSNSDFSHQRSKSCYSNRTQRPQYCHSSHRKCGDRYNIDSDDSCTRLGSAGNQTVEILEENVVNIDLPPLMWFGYNRTPKILSATNTGRTILVNGQWAGGRPYISGGPLSGSYIFSQIHFHSPSEHEIDGKRYPLEMHVVHYKSSYLTQERAMKEKDGTIVLVYLFQIVQCEPTVLSQICKFASCLEIRNTRKELSKISLDQFMKPFNSNYYTYRSSVPMDKSSYLLQWIISCNNLSVTSKEVEELSLIMNSCDSTSHSTAMEREDDVIFRVGEEDYCDWPLNSQVAENPCCQDKKVESNTSVCENQSDASVREEKSSRKNSSKKSSREKSPKKSREKSPKKSREKSPKKSREKSPKKSREKSPKKSDEKSPKKSREKSPKKSTEKPPKKSTEKSPKKSSREKSSKKSVREKPSKTSASKKSSDKSVSKKSSKTSAKKKSSDKSESKKSSKTSAEGKSSEQCVSENSSDISVSKKSSTDKRFSETSSCEKFSKTSADEKSSESSCSSIDVKKKKTKKRDRRQSVKKDECANTTPSCSKSDVEETEKKGKKSKDVCVTKEQSTKSKSSEKCPNQDEKVEICEKKSTNSSTKENEGENKMNNKSAESKCIKERSKRSAEDLTENCSETEASKSVEKTDCSEPNLKTEGKSCEKIKTLYEKEKKAPPCPPPRATKTVEIKDECVQSPKTSYNGECSKTVEINECVQTLGNTEKDDDCESEDVQVNYLFMSTPSSVHSNVEKVESDTTNSKIKDGLREKENAVGTKDLIKLPSNSIVHHAVVKAENFPLVKPEPTKEFYLHTKHVFRKKGSNTEFTPQAFQECHILVERNRDVLQEYNGTFYPNQLLPGYYEQVNLLTRYSDPEDLKIRATECIAKLESVNELSIRAKFLVSETSLDDQISETLSSNKKSEDSIKSMKSFFDAQCQCEQPRSISKAINTNFVEEEVDSAPCKSMIKWDLRSMELENLEFRNTKLVKVQHVGVGRELDTIKGNEGKKLTKVSVEQNGGIKILKNANTLITGSETSSKESFDQKYELEVEKTINDSLTNSSEKRKKATYFVYDRIEKDDNTGKKIFVGRFRSRDEFEVLFRKKNTFQSNRMSSDLSEMQSCSHQTIITGNETQENVWKKFRVEDSPGLKIKIPSKEGCPDKKSEAKSPEVITLHKFDPKHYRLKSAKKDSKNLIVGKISNKIDADSEKFSQLAEMLGVDKNRYPKISFYEFQEADVPNLNDFCLDDNSKFDVITVNGVENFGKIDKSKVFPSTSNRSDSLDEEFSEDLECSSSFEKKAKSSRGKHSQPAVVVVPIETDSLSKVEFLLIENGNDVKKQKVENKYTSYLKHYKRLILKLQVFVSVVVRDSSKNEVECTSVKSLDGLIFFSEFRNLGR